MNIKQLRAKYHRSREKSTKDTPQFNGYSHVLLSLDNNQELRDARDQIESLLEGTHSEGAKEIYRQFLLETGPSKAEQSIQRLKELASEGTELAIMPITVTTDRNGNSIHKLVILIAVNESVMDISELIGNLGVYKYIKSRTLIGYLRADENYYQLVEHMGAVVHNNRKAYILKRLV